MAIFVFVYLCIRVLLYIWMFPGDLVMFLGDFNPTSKDTGKRRQTDAIYFENFTI